MKNDTMLPCLFFFQYSLFLVVTGVGEFGNLGIWITSFGLLLFHLGQAASSEV